MTGGNSALRRATWVARRWHERRDCEILSVAAAHAKTPTENKYNSEGANDVRERPILDDQA